MLERNEQGKLARQYFIECEERLAAVAPEQHQIAVNNWRKERIEARDFHKVMCAALAVSRALQGKDTNATHYINEAYTHQWRCCNERKERFGFSISRHMEGTYCFSTQLMPVIR